MDLTIQRIVPHTFLTIYLLKHDEHTCYWFSCIYNTSTVKIRKGDHGVDLRYSNTAVSLVE